MVFGVRLMCSGCADVPNAGVITLRTAPGAETDGISSVTTRLCEDALSTRAKMPTRDDGGVVDTSSRLAIWSRYPSRTDPFDSRAGTPEESTGCGGADLLPATTGL